MSFDDLLGTIKNKAGAPLYGLKNPDLNLASLEEMLIDLEANDVIYSSAPPDMYPVGFTGTVHYSTASAFYVNECPDLVFSINFNKSYNGYGGSYNNLSVSYKLDKVMFTFLDLFYTSKVRCQGKLFKKMGWPLL